MELLEIQPKHLQFPFEVKKQSSCVIRLGNRTDQYVAFKVKTTSPKKYSVRPNAGIVQPNATSEFIVTMLAQAVAPPNLQCKDKFLIQSTIVPEGAKEEDITKDTFSKDSGYFVEEKRLKVFLVSASYSPILAPVNEELRQGSSVETSMAKDKPPSGVENTPPTSKVSSNVEELDAEKKMVKASLSNDAQVYEGFVLVDDFTAANEQQCIVADMVNEKEVQIDTLGTQLGENSESFKVKLNLMDTKLDEVRDAQGPETSNFSDEMRADNQEQSKQTEDMKETEAAKTISNLKFFTYSENIKSKLNLMDVKLKEAEISIKLLSEENIMATQEKENLKCEYEALKRQKLERKVQVGFPLLFVLMVALISLAVGYYSHAS